MFMVGKGIELAKLDFFARAGQPINLDRANIGAWYAQMKARPSAAA
jgi:hypothetical protein